MEVVKNTDNGAGVDPGVAAPSAAVAVSVNGVVTIAWSPSVTPGFERTRVIRSTAGFAKAATEGIVVADAAPGVTIHEDAVGAGGRVFYTLFATNDDTTAFSAPFPVGEGLVIVNGTRRCPAAHVLRGQSDQGGLLCTPDSRSVPLECVSASKVKINAGEAQVQCPFGYTITGGGFTGIGRRGFGASDGFASRPGGDGWFVGYEDLDPGDFEAVARCCRVVPDDVVSVEPAADGGCPPGQAVIAFDEYAGSSCASLLPAAVAAIECQQAVDTGGSDQTPAIAVCPDGWSPTGGGFADIDAKGLGTVSDNLTSVPVVGGWSVDFPREEGHHEAFALCCRLTPPVPSEHPGQACPSDAIAVGVEWSDGAAALVCDGVEPWAQLECEPTPPVTGDASADAVASCPDGQVLTGGGFQDVDQDGAGMPGERFDAAPEPTGQAFRVRHLDEVDEFGAFAVCCSAEVGLTEP